MHLAERELEIRDPRKDEVLSHRCSENGDDGMSGPVALSGP